MNKLGNQSIATKNHYSIWTGHLLLQEWKVYDKFWTVDDALQSEMILGTEQWNVLLVFNVKRDLVNLVAKWHAICSSQPFADTKQSQIVTQCKTRKRYKDIYLQTDCDLEIQTTIKYTY